MTPQPSDDETLWESIRVSWLGLALESALRELDIIDGSDASSEGDSSPASPHPEAADAASEPTGGARSRPPCRLCSAAPAGGCACVPGTRRRRRRTGLPTSEAVTRSMSRELLHPEDPGALADSDDTDHEEADAAIAAEDPGDPVPPSPGASPSVDFNMDGPAGWLATLIEVATAGEDVLDLAFVTSSEDDHAGPGLPPAGHHLPLQHAPALPADGPEDP
ncbi:hypothetical protein H696_04780 [Fonticula alba]|uniref:Uncharacterized protein n=1 Tax=Fonticula alba TaxID=691883 RepID=A0A058Z4S6_FONAL|nr:hypothetical protein H696_04780 [Fonticula alba]KCV68487.1 hypothetical protein H696_04780 [Fonticula alba]|eukprot:XP_009496919.1 hypothetical protein H696_04780 [Fonticula alba]